MSKQKPYISVIIPTFNRAAYIADSINSVLDQEDASWPIEIIVIDDGSSDDTEELITQKFGDKVRYVRTPQSGGRPAVPRNIGIKMAEGELIAFQDSDDVWVPRKLKSQIPAFEENPNLVLSFGTAGIMDQNGKKGDKLIISDPEHLKSGEKFESLLKDNVISTLTVVARKSAIAEVGYFNESPDLSAIEDYELWLRLTAEFPRGVRSIHKALAYYRVHDQNISTASDLQAVKKILNVYEVAWLNKNLTARQRDSLEDRMTSIHESLGRLEIADSSNGPIVSVIMSVFNGEDYLRAAIEGILSQTYTNFEFIIIDDGSTDSSVEIIKKYSDRRIRLIQQTNHGLVYSLNKAIRLSRGQYLARQDADDISLPSRFEKELQLISSSPTLGVVGTYFTYVDEKTLESKITIAYPSLPIDVKRSLYFTNPLGHGTVMMRKQVFDGLDVYSDKYGPTEDMELWHRIADHWDIAIVPESLYWYRLNDNSISHTKSDIQKKFTDKIIDEQWVKPFMRKGPRRMVRDGRYYRSMHSLYAEQVYRQYVSQQIDIARAAFLRGWLRTGLYSAGATCMLELSSWRHFVKPMLIGIVRKIKRGDR